MERLFISTNYVQLFLVIEDRRNQVGINLLNGDPQLLYWNIDENKFQSEPVIETNLFLIKDVSMNPFHGSAITIDKDKDYLMHHFTCNHINVGFKNVHSEGSHISNNQYYKGVFDIIFSEVASKEKASKIIEFLFPTAEAILGKKLDLLHSLLVPPVNIVSANAQWEEISKTVKKAQESGINVSLTSDDKALNDFVSEVRSITEAFDPKYIEALTQLRDKLLLS